jgi:hypothetical protein
LHRLQRLRFFASASPDSVASPTTATADAAAVPSADRRVLRRVLTSPTSRFSDSNGNPSTAASNLHDVLASVALMNRRPVERPLVADREEARCSALGHAIGLGGVVDDAADIQWYTAPGKSDPSTTLDVSLL